MTFIDVDFFLKDLSFIDIHYDALKCGDIQRVSFVYTRQYSI
jgi:hypothetical protein